MTTTSDFVTGKAALPTPPPHGSLILLRFTAMWREMTERLGLPCRFREHRWTYILDGDFECAVCRTRVYRPRDMPW